MNIHVCFCEPAGVDLCYDTVLKTEMNLQDTITEFFALRAFIIWLAL